MTDRDDRTRERVEDPHLLHARRTYANAVEVLDQLKSGHAEIERRVEVLRGWFQDAFDRGEGLALDALVDDQLEAEVPGARLIALVIGRELKKAEAAKQDLEKALQRMTKVVEIAAEAEQRLEG